MLIADMNCQYLDREPRRRKPTAHLSYDEGLNIIRQFIRHSSYHTVEDIQAFTNRHIPAPHWVKIQEEAIPAEYLSKAANAIIEQLGPKGLLRVGGKQWWQWRGPLEEMKGEWIEMKGDYHARKRTDAHGRRVMLYVHGGAYYFGSVDTHRYQMQRHARKLKARVFARYVNSRRGDFRQLTFTLLVS
jgi:acetyl esterase/lipase